MSYRNTYVKVHLQNVYDNVKTIIKHYPNYKYYIGVVKADSYGHNSDQVIHKIIDAGCNYLAVSSLDEALEIRNNFDIPILCLGIIHPEYMNICEEKHIDVTVTNLDYLKAIRDYHINIHIKIDTGMNRLGVKDQDEFNLMMKELPNSNLYLKGIYTHIYDAHNAERTQRQIVTFKDITKDIDLSKIDVVHIAQSDTLLNYPKIDICNSCRLGIIMYGLTDNNLSLKSTLELVSEVIEIKHLHKGETVSYNGNYVASKDEIIGIVSIGYADGINRKLTGAKVYINNKPYPIVGNICMDMLMIKIDYNVKLFDKVSIYKDINHIKELSDYLDTIPYELICNITKRVPRVYEE